MEETDDRAAMPQVAMVMAAGLGTRMRPFNGQIPKPLVQVGGKALIDHVLDRLAAAGVGRAVVNVHHLADQIERHLAGRTAPQIVISDERDALLGTAGGPIKAMDRLGPGPFYLVNSDTIWIDGARSNLVRLAEAFDAARMDALLLMASTATASGYSGRGDFSLASDGRLTRRGEREVVPFVYAGAAILTPAFFAGVAPGPSSMSPLFDRAAAAGRLHGLRLDGIWMHVGTPEAVAAAEARLLASFTASETRAVASVPSPLAGEGGSKV
jgi:MurNAc alpha-1-phosphate uridylyltransferase